MPRVDAPYPGSLATVMSKSGAIPSTSPSRLPSYRNHTVRYHPYSAAARPRREDLQWQPVDASNAQDAQTGGLQLTFEVPEAVRLQGVTAACQPVSNGDVSGSELDSPIVDGELVLEHKEAETQPKTAEEAADHRRRRGPGTKLVVAFMNMMNSPAIRRRYIALCAATAFLNAQMGRGRIARNESPTRRTK